MKTRKGFFILILTIAVLCLTVYFSLRTTSETLSYAESEYFNGGDGSENSPYEINSSTHLSNLAYLTNNGIKNSNGDFYSKLHYKVTADIVLPNDFTPIGNNSSYLEIYAECTHGDLNFITSQWNYYYHNFYVYNGESFVNASDTYSSETTYYVKPTSFPCVFYGIFYVGTLAVKRGYIWAFTHIYFGFIAKTM